MTTTRCKDPAGLLGDLIHIELDGKADDKASAAALLSGLSPSSRIDALRKHPELVALADHLGSRLQGPRKSADMHLLHDIAQAEHKALYLAAAPQVIRDQARQNGTKKKRRPEVQAWIKERSKLALTTRELWDMAPDWITDQIGFHRFQKRVTAARKEIR